MKKSLLALAVLGSLAAVAQAQSSVTIYGIIDTGVTYQNKQDNKNGNGSNNGLFAVTSGILSGSRLGFKGTEDLGGGLKANFQLESGFNNDTGALNGQDAGSVNLFRRTSTVGLSSTTFGSVNLGRQTDFAYTHTSAYSGAGYLGAVVQSNGTSQTRLQGDRTNNSIRWDMPNTAGLTGGLMYGFGEQAGAGSAGQAFGAGLKYDNGPISFGGSYYQSKTGKTPADRSLYGATAAGTTDNTTALKTFTLGGSYNFGIGKLYGSWSRAKFATNGGLALLPATDASQSMNAGGGNSVLGGGLLSASDKLDLYEIGYNHNLTSSLVLMTNFSHTRVNFINGTSKGKLNELTAGLDYFLSKRTDLYAIGTYMRSTNMSNPLSLSNGQPAANANGTNAYALGVGIRHAF